MRTIADWEKSEIVEKRTKGLMKQVSQYVGSFIFEEQHKTIVKKLKCITEKLWEDIAKGYNTERGKTRGQAKCPHTLS